MSEQGRVKNRLINETSNCPCYSASVCTVQNSYWLKSNVYHTANRELRVISLLKRLTNTENFRENSFE